MKENKERVAIEEPRLARLIFADTRFGWLWLPLRLYLGWSWWEAGWHKFVDPKWMGTAEARVFNQCGGAHLVCKNHYFW